MILLGIDLETGASFNTPHKDNFITEVGAVLYDTETQQPVQIVNTLVKCDREIAQEATEYTKITNDMVQTWGVAWDKVEPKLRNMAKKACAIVAHNGLGFDKPILDAKTSLPDTLWIDTMTDVPYPKNCKSTNLTYLAGFHKMYNPFPHRAVTDVLTMLEVLMHYDVDDILETAKTPLVRVVANVGFHDNQLAKDQKFRWEPAPVKEWYKIMRQRALETTDTDEWGFNYRVEECAV